ncbi:MAG TPA: hypothetical protein VIT88_10240 [Pyrinomonadaceae bacterium]
MNTNRQTIRIWAIVVVTLTLGTLLSSILAAAMLDALIGRPEAGGGSVTTIIPGFVYATATVMKICILAGLVSLVVALTKLVWAETAENALPAPILSVRRFPIWGVTSTALAPLTPLVGTLVILISQTFAVAQPLITDFSQFSRSAVVVSLFLISAGAVSAVTSLVKRERPRLVPVVGLITSAVLIGLFWHFEFYALGFDQDTWAPH